MDELGPHPLVTDVGRGLGLGDFAALKKSARALDAAKVAAEAARPAAGAKSAYSDAIEALAEAVADQENLPDLTLFAGFLGGQYRRDKQEWRLLYLDSRLSNWLFIREDDIVLHERLKDENAPSGLRDALWVRSSAMVVRGSGPRSNQGRFLVGEFTQAGDFSASTTGGTFSAASGLLCEATTPGCCWGARTRG